MKNALLISIVLSSLCSFGQTLYVPGGTSGIGTSTVAGNVGIGTTTPSQKLEVNGSILSTANYGFIISPPSGDAVIKRGNSGLLAISSNGGSSDVRINYNYGGGSGGLSIFDGGTVNNTNLSVTSAGNLCIVPSGGKVGIGTISPAFKLDVAGTVSTTNLTINPTASGNSQIYFKNQGNLDWDLGTQVGEANQNFNLYNRGTSSIALSINKTSNNIGIGTSSPDAKLAVKGTVHANEVKVDLNVPGPDYVFANNYQLLTLNELKTYIDQNKHLPEVPSAAAMEANGINLGEMNMLLLKKVEELTLYIIEQEKRINKLENNK